MRLLALYFTLSISVILTGNEAAAVCKWTHERTEFFFSKDQTYMERPKLEKESCKPGLPPICSGYVYCPEPGKAPRGTVVACNAIQKNNKWRCPTAQICSVDPVINASYSSTPPAKTNLNAAPVDTSDEPETTE